MTKAKTAVKAAKEPKSPKVPKEMVNPPETTQAPLLPADAASSEEPQATINPTDPVAPPVEAASQTDAVPEVKEKKKKDPPKKKGDDVPEVGDVVSFYTQDGPVKAEVLEVCNDRTVHLTHGEGIVNRAVQKGNLVGHWSW